MKSSKAEAETRTSTQEKIAALEDNTSLLKDYSWLSQVCPYHCALLRRSPADTMLAS